jgi:molecular chaperone DnaJ
MKITDPWAELGVARGAGDAEIKAAYRRLVSRWHPDRNAAADASDKMQRINRAYQLLTEGGAGAHVGEADEASGFDGSQFADFAQDFARHFRAGAGFGDGRHGRGRARGGWSPGEDDWVAAERPSEPKTLRRKTTITLKEAACGCTRTVSGSTVDLCPKCGGAGLFTALWASCPSCYGEGRVYDDYGYRRLKCRDCRGNGTAHHACQVCAGSGKAAQPREWKLEIRIPAGVLGGDVVSARGHGQRGAADARGDLELEIAIKPHALFSFDAQRRLQCVVPVDIFKFLAGGAVDVPTLGGGSVRFDLAQGRVQEVAGRGFPGRDGVPGVLMLVAQPVFPRQLSEREAVYLRSLASDLEQSGYTRCEAVAAWLGAAEGFVQSASAPPHSKAKGRRSPRR